MPIHQNLGTNQPYFNNHFSEDFFVPSHASVLKIDNKHSNNKSFFRCWLKSIEKNCVKTVNKVPQRKNWPNYQETLKTEELLRRCGEYGAKTGIKLGNKYFEGVDIDIERDHIPLSLQKRLERNFELLAKFHRISYIKTQRGYHVYCLFDQLTPNENLYHLDKYGKKRTIGGILSTGRQLQGVGSRFKKWVANGKWFWHLKDRNELKAKLARFFFSLDNVKEITNENISFNPNHKQTEKLGENQEKSLYRVIKVIKAQIITKRLWTKKPDHYQVFYRNSQQAGYFILDGYFRDKQNQIQPNLTTNLIIARGYKYQFYLDYY